MRFDYRRWCRVGDSLGERIRARRQRKGWTLKDLARVTELSVPYLSDIERRPGVNPTLETLSTIANALECTVSDLLGSDAAVGGGGPPLPVSLQRFIKTEDFDRQVKRIAQRAKRPARELEREIVNFLAMAPKRSKGDLASDDWRRLLDLYFVIMD
jgi:transcriptional regulator with XRE-family HTH domain